MSASSDWPILREYDEDHLIRIALPLGGIGTGTVSPGGRGDLRDWETSTGPPRVSFPGNVSGRHRFSPCAPTQPEGRR